ncbi:hypothetical protein N9164_04845 [Draconibacterium sp.]|nr:hypothetical protein [Draconibacterium sp.]
MNKQKQIYKIKSAVWRVKVGIHSPFLENYNGIKYWKVTAYLN